MTEATYEMMNSGEIQVNLPGGVQVFAKLLDDFPVENVYMSWAQGLIYLRKVRRRDGTIEVRDVTLAAIRYSLARVRRAKDAQANGDRDLRRRLRAARLATPKPGAPSPERRKRGPIERVPSPKREAASDAALVYHAPDNLARLHRNGTITNNMLNASARFHADWIMAGLEGLRAANMMRASRGTGGEVDAVLDARNQVRRVCDRLGGYRSPGFQVLICVVGEGATLAAWSLKERAGPWRLNNDSAKGVLTCALGVLEGFNRSAP